jgi:hypothetical protein
LLRHYLVAAVVDEDVIGLDVSVQDVVLLEVPAGIMQQASLISGLGS